MAINPYKSGQPWEFNLPGLSEFSSPDFFRTSLLQGESPTLSQMTQQQTQDNKPDFKSLFNLKDQFAQTFNFANTKKAALHNMNVDAQQMKPSINTDIQMPTSEEASKMINDGVDKFKVDPSVVNEASFGEKFAGSTFGKNFGMWSAGLDTANSLLTGFLGEKSEYSGAKGELTKSLDAAYDQVSDAVAAIPGFGQAASLIMKGGKALGAVTNKLGGGTDGMTTADAILGSSFLQLTPFGLINGFGGSKAATIKKDEDVFETVGSSYTGTGYTVDDALTKSGKKYGLISSGARKNANSQIYEARRQQGVMSDIADEATNRFAIRNSMSAINGNRRAFQMQGGYDQASIRVGRNGISMKAVMTAKRVVSALKYKKGGSIPNVQVIEEVHLPEFKDGGKLEETVYYINEISIEEVLPEFKEGGKFNVIPEGALHARLHHMENAENLTKKGIPVVTEKEGGELEQQAEIEKEEIIFRLEVTQKLEELMKIYNSEDSSQKEKDEVAIEAGKLLAHEILNNTIDNTNNLL